MLEISVILILAPIYAQLKHRQTERIYQYRIPQLNTTTVCWSGKRTALIVPRHPRPAILVPLNPATKRISLNELKSHCEPLTYPACCLPYRDKLQYINCPHMDMTLKLCIDLQHEGHSIFIQGGFYINQCNKLKRDLMRSSSFIFKKITNFLKK